MSKEGWTGGDREDSAARGRAGAIEREREGERGRGVENVGGENLSVLRVPTTLLIYYFVSNYIAPQKSIGMRAAVATIGGTRRATVGGACTTRDAVDRAHVIAREPWGPSVVCCADAPRPRPLRHCKRNMIG